MKSRLKATENMPSGFFVPDNCDEETLENIKHLESMIAAGSTDEELKEDDDLIARGKCVLALFEKINRQEWIRRAQ